MFDEEFFRRLFDLSNQTPVIIRIPSDDDINEKYEESLEQIAYRRQRAINNTEIDKVNWSIAIKCLSEDVLCITSLIKENKLRCPKEIKEFVENCCSNFNKWNNVYREGFNSIKDFRDSLKKRKSIDDMNAEELREYIRTHNIK